MKPTTHYEENPFGKNMKIGKRVFLPDLPSPRELAAAEKTTKVTLLLNEDSVRFFKKQAAKYKTPYQAMIRRLLDAYASRCGE